MYGVNCGVLEWVKGNTLRCFGHIKRMESEEFMKKVYMSESVGPNSRGRSPWGWRDRVKECMCERGANRGSVWTGRSGGFSVVATCLEDIPGGSEASQL